VQEVDENAPEAWNRMYSSFNPDEIYMSLKDNEQEEITRWNEQRSRLIQKRLQDEVQAELETQTSLFRDSAPFLRVKVHSINPREGRCESGLLTIWNPKEEQLNLLKEGSFVQVYNLTVRDSMHDGQLQLTANKRTVIEAYTFESLSIPDEMGYLERRYLTVIDVHTLSHRSVMEVENVTHLVEFDTAVVFVYMTKSSNPDAEIIFYVTDETYLMLRIHCKSLPYSLKMLLAENENFGSAFGLRDLRLRPFDTSDQCAVAEFTDFSSVVATNDRIDQLTNWAAVEGTSGLVSITGGLKAKLPLWEQIGESRVGCGYIMGLRFEESSQQLYIRVDCCGYCCREWELPSPILRQMVSAVSSTNSSVVHSPYMKSRIEELGILGSILSARGTLWQFRLTVKPSSTYPLDCVVSEATIADKFLLNCHYLVLSEPELPDTEQS
jgi:hypothetical protein